MYNCTGTVFSTTYGTGLSKTGTPGTGQYRGARMAGTPVEAVPGYPGYPGTGDWEVVPVHLYVIYANVSSTGLVLGDNAGTGTY